MWEDDDDDDDELELGTFTTNSDGFRRRDTNGWTSQFWWKLLHFILFFLSGSLLLLAAEVLLHSSQAIDPAKYESIADILFVISSIVFSSAHLLELFTSYSDLDRFIKYNILLCALGWLLFLIYPSSILSDSSALPLSLLGTFFLCFGHVWKAIRIIRTEQRWTREALATLLQEVAPALGAFIFFSTLVSYSNGDCESCPGAVVAGSVFFLVSSLILALRHFAFGL